ncbi:hypothetical protein MRB53_021490 [Persea americana]|uniref:Uncharacterized protein n=1 Tax=Persea americana TaxID=3435 RepID=A0ACC2L564_PERAE|nr:hypothetical protein MRB53_021490 [Persea americana]
MGSTNSTMSSGSFSKNNSKAEVHPYVESMAKGIITNRMILEKVREQQQSLCDELGLHYKSIKMKLVILKVFRGVCRAIFLLINFAIVVCQVVLPFAGHNALAAALGSAGADVGAGLSALGGTMVTMRWANWSYRCMYMLFVLVFRHGLEL